MRCGRFSTAASICLPDVAPMPDGDGVHIAAGELGLTARQTDVLKLMVQGKPNKLICRDLTLSEGTVKVHVSAILKALRVHSRTEAIAVLARRGISVDTLAARRAESPRTTLIPCASLPAGTGAANAWACGPFHDELDAR